MKNKKITLSIIISAILIFIPTQIHAWLQLSTYEACNIVNLGISWLIKTVAFIITISYITGVVQYIKHSKHEKKQKTQNILTWSAISIIQIIFLLVTTVWVKEIGMETYWSNGTRYQFNEIDGYISYGIRALALIFIIAYIITSIVYFAKSKNQKIQKIENIVKWQVITFAVVAVLLILARRW